jgi:hypothetical protein
MCCVFLSLLLKKKKHFPMYYLVVQNLGVERCIHRSEDDIYEDGMSFSCTPDLGFYPAYPVRKISIVCSENPDSPLLAEVYRD